MNCVGFFFLNCSTSIQASYQQLCFAKFNQSWFLNLIKHENETLFPLKCKNEWEPPSLLFVTLSAWKHYSFCARAYIFVNLLYLAVRLRYDNRKLHKYSAKSTCPFLKLKSGPFFPGFLLKYPSLILLKFVFISFSLTYAKSGLSFCIPSPLFLFFFL